MFKLRNNEYHAKTVYIMVSCEYIFENWASCNFGMLLYYLMEITGNIRENPPPSLPRIMEKNVEGSSTVRMHYFKIIRSSKAPEPDFARYLRKFFSLPSWIHTTVWFLPLGWRYSVSSGLSCCVSGKVVCSLPCRVNVSWQQWCLIWARSYHGGMTLGRALVSFGFGSCFLMSWDNSVLC